MAIRQGLKWLGIATGTLLVILLGLFVALYFVLRSGTFTETAIQNIAPLLKPFGLVIERLASARIDPLKSITIEGLALSWQGPNQERLYFQAQALDLNYSLSALWQNRLDIQKIHLRDAKIAMRLPLSTDSTPPPPSDPSDELFNLEDIAKLLSEPPMVIQVTDLELERIALDINITQATQQFSYQGELQAAHVSLAWSPTALNGQAKLQLGQQGRSELLFSHQDEANAYSLTTQPNFSVLYNWQLDKVNEVWRLTKADINHHIILANSTLFSSSTQDEPSGVIEKTELHFSASSNSLKTDQSVATPFLPLSLNGTLSFNTPHIAIDDFKQTDLALSMDANQQFQLQFAGQLDDLKNSQGHMQLDVKQTLNIKTLALTQQKFNLNLADFHWQWALTSTPPRNLDETGINFNIALQSDASKFTLKKRNDDKQRYWDVTLKPSLVLSTSGNVQPTEPWPTTLTLHSQPKVTLENIQATVNTDKKTRRYQIQRHLVDILTEIENGQFDVHALINSKNVRTPKNVKAFNLNNTIKLHGDTKFKHVSTQLQSKLDALEWLNLRLDITNQPNVLRVKHTIETTLSPKLTRYSPLLKELNRWGEMQATLTGHAELRHQHAAIQQIDTATFEQLPMSASGTVNIVQHQPPHETVRGILLTKPANINYKINKSASYQIQLNVDASSIQIPPLLTPLNLHAATHTDVTWPLSKTNTSGKIIIDNQPVLDYQVTLNHQNHAFSAHSHATIHLNPDWQRYHAELSELEKIGELNATLQLDASISHPHATLLDLSLETLNKTSGKGKLALTISQPPDRPGSVFRLSAPLTLHQNVQWSEKGFTANNRFVFSASTTSPTIELKKIAGELKLSGTPGILPRQANVSLSLDKGQLILIDQHQSEAPIDLSTLVVPLSLTAAVSRNDKIYQLDPFSFSMGNKLISLQATGNLTTDGKDGELESVLIVNLADVSPNNAVFSGSGQITAPLQVTLADAKHISLDGAIKFKDLKMRWHDLEINTLTGRLKFDEELILTDKQHIQFSYIIEPDPFQRVDFSRIQPYLNNPVVRIKQISFDNKTIGPMLSTIQLQQNLLQLQRLDLDLLGGHLSGQLTIDTRPGAQKIGLLSRVTQVDLRKLLKPNHRSQIRDYAPISARAALEFDLQQRLLEGRVDLTAISQTQLLQLLEVIDPDYQDEQLSRVRNALRIAYPKQVNIAMQGGLMDISVTLSLIPKPIAVYGLPLTPLIQTFLGDLLRKIEQLP